MQGQEVARKIGAVRYCETSAKTGEGVEKLFEAAARLALLRSGGIGKLSGLKKLFKIK